MRTKVFDDVPERSSIRSERQPPSRKTAWPRCARSTRGRAVAYKCDWLHEFLRQVKTISRFARERLCARLGGLAACEARAVVSSICFPADEVVMALVARVSMPIIANERGR
jgi:hypothetical protein